MNSDDTNNLRSAINDIDQIDIGIKIAESHPNQEASEIRFGHLSAVDIIINSKHLINNFFVFLDSDTPQFVNTFYIWGWEPKHLQPYNVQIEVPRKNNINSVVNDLKNSLMSNNWNQYAISLELAIGFQISIGIWDTSIKQTTRKPSNKIAQILEEFNLRKEQFVTLFQDIQNIKKINEEVATKRKEEVKAVAEEHEAAKATVKEIASLLQSASDSNGQITALLSNQKENFSTSTSQVSAIEKQRSEIAIILAGLSEKLTDAEQRLEFMQEKADLVNELAGTAAAGVLGQKFESRKNQLAWSSRCWLFGTIISLVVAGLWIGYAHEHYMQNAGELWKTVALNFGILLPAGFLVGFFARQFGRIRHFEEEYAFRSSVAMTVSAFADRIASNKEEHDRLITETVEKLYKLPVLLQERDTGGWFSQRGTERMVKATTELITAVKKPIV